MTSNGPGSNDDGNGVRGLIAVDGVGVAVSGLVEVESWPLDDEDVREVLNKKPVLVAVMVVDTEAEPML